MADDYSAESIEILDLRQAIRKRPGMYVGSTDDGSGALQLLLEVLANAVDQVLLGRCTRVDVRVDADDVVTVTDDGPGIPAGSLVERLERRSSLPTVDGHRPHVHLGLGGLGLPVASALSDPLEVDTVHAGEQATVTYAGGLQQVALQVSPTARLTGPSSVA